MATVTEQAIAAEPSPFGGKAPAQPDGATSFGDGSEGAWPVPSAPLEPAERPEPSAAVGLHQKGEVVPDLVVAGEMKRHAQTAAAVLEGAGWSAPVEVDPGWNEFDHVQMLQAHEPPRPPARR